MEQIVIIGGGGHAKVLIDCLEKEGKYQIAGVLDDHPNVTQVLHYKVHRRGSMPEFMGLPTIIAIGNGEVRQKIAAECATTFITTVHPTAVVSKYAKIGVGSQIFAGAVLNADASVGDHCIVNTGAVVEHDCIIQDFVHLSPHSSLAGGVSVGAFTHIGIGATVIENVTIGSHVIIGAGAVVVDDIPDHCTAVGIPAKPIKFNNSPL